MKINEPDLRLKFAYRTHSREVRSQGQPSHLRPSKVAAKRTAPLVRITEGEKSCRPLAPHSVFPRVRSSEVTNDAGSAIILDRNS